MDDTAIYVSTPNLTLESLGGKHVTKQGVVLDRYKSLRECSQIRNIPIKVLRLASSRSFPGITVNGSVQWEVLQPHLATQYAKLLAETTAPEPEAADDRSKWELKKLKEEVIKLQNHNRTKSKDFISRKLVLKSVNQLYGNVFAQLSRFLLQEQPGKCDGMSAIQLKAYNKDYLLRLLSGLKQMQSIWDNAEDVKEEETPQVPEALNEA